MCLPPITVTCRHVSLPVNKILLRWHLSGMCICWQDFVQRDNVSGDDRTLSISIWLKSAPSQVILTHPRPPPPQAPNLTAHLLHPYHSKQSYMPRFSQTCLLMGRPPCAPAARAWTVFPPDAASTLQAADKSPTCSQEAQTPFTVTEEAKFTPGAGRIYTIFNAPCRLLSDLVLALHKPM